MVRGVGLQTYYLGGNPLLMQQVEGSFCITDKPRAGFYRFDNSPIFVTRTWHTKQAYVLSISRSTLNRYHYHEYYG